MTQGAARTAAARWAECAAMFVLGPALFVALAQPRWLFPALWVWALACLAILLRDRGFDKRQLWNTRGFQREVGPMLGRFAVLGGLITAAVLLLTPAEAFGLPRENTRL